MLTIRQAALEDLPALNILYDGVIERFRAQSGGRGWSKGIYPTERDFRRAIQAGTMYTGWLEGTLAAGMVVTQGTDAAYEPAPWRVEAEDRETAVIHTLGVSPELSRRGLALEMIEHAVDLARARGWKALRLDVLKENAAAQRLYERAGFQFIAGKSMFYESVGQADFLLYEYAV